MFVEQNGERERERREREERERERRERERAREREREKLNEKKDNSEFMYREGETMPGKYERVVWEVRESSPGSK